MLLRNELLVLLKIYIYQYLSMERSDHNFYIFTIWVDYLLNILKINFVTEVYITLPIF